MFLPISQKWGGGPLPGEAMVEGYKAPASVTPPPATLVPLPTDFAGREELR
jgi:hypothetical protein